MSDLGTATQPLFHGPLGSTSFRQITHSSTSRHYGSPWISTLEQRDGAAWSTLRRQVANAIWLSGTGILTCFPFDILELRYILGSTNPRLTNIAEETWPFRRSRFSRNYAATIARIFVPMRSTPPHEGASAHTGRLPTRSSCDAPMVSVVGLSPVHFRGPKPRLVSCYALFKG